MIKPTKRDRFLGGLWGSLVGDALGVPVEFMSRAEVARNPVTDMRGYGTHNQPPGTWSDDSSMLLCTVESLLEHEFSPEDMAERFVRWAHKCYWTPHGRVFDIGNATSRALHRAASGTPPQECGGRSEYDNGNGSLMRILPVCLRFAELDMETFVARINAASAITHAHPRSLMACVLYGLVIRSLLHDTRPLAVWQAAQKTFHTRYAAVLEHDPGTFATLANPRLADFEEVAISSGGYVIDTLTASLWCLLTTDNFSDCVLKAVNLGGDTDTTGCVAGGLAGVCYGLDAIPAKWRDALARKKDVAGLFDRFAA